MHVLQIICYVHTNMQFAFKATFILHNRIQPYSTFLSLRLVHPPSSIWWLCILWGGDKWEKGWSLLHPATVQHWTYCCSPPATPCRVASRWDMYIYSPVDLRIL